MQRYYKVRKKDRNGGSQLTPPSPTTTSSTTFSNKAKPIVVVALILLNGAYLQWQYTRDAHAATRVYWEEEVAVVKRRHRMIPHPPATNIVTRNTTTKHRLRRRLRCHSCTFQKRPEVPSKRSVSERSKSGDTSSLASGSLSVNASTNRRAGPMATTSPTITHRCLAHRVVLNGTIRNCCRQNIKKSTRQRQQGPSRPSLLASQVP